MWLKIKQQGLRRFWSMFPLARVPFWYCFLKPQPYLTMASARFLPSSLWQDYVWTLETFGPDAGALGQRFETGSLQASKRTSDGVLGPWGPDL